MSSSSEFYIFRDSRRPVPVAQLVAGVRTKLLRTHSLLSPDKLLFLLLQAGELECGLNDTLDAESTSDIASRLTDVFARSAVAFDRSICDRERLASEALPMLDQLRYSGDIRVGVPEGFAYYALHPLDYADLVERLNLISPCVLVIGVRSIGTTLSAVVAAKLRQSGVAPQRLTVRPTGHPYDRQCELDPRQRSAIAKAVAANTEFLICDEGPGRSGSSLLSVAEALEREGVEQSRITILCSHEPNVGSLCAQDAPRRWGRYRVVASGMTRRLPDQATECMGSAGWRGKFIPEGRPWPAVWPQMERLKYGSSDGQTLLTFEGHGPYGAVVCARNHALARAGFGLSYLGQTAGFGRHVVRNGRLAEAADMSSRLLSHMAEYCAWRAAEFAIDDVESSDLETMARVNFERAFGAAPDGLALPVERPTVCDSRMMPCGWLFTDDRRWLKLDSAIHGDDHFFPGPCDIAWDLAGIVIEWNLSAAARKLLLEKYQEASGDDAAGRLRDYELAYTIFRIAWSSMAAASVGVCEDADRLLCDYQKYRHWLQAHAKGARVRNHTFLKMDSRSMTSTGLGS